MVAVIVAVILLVLIVVGLWWGNRKSKEADEHLKYVNEGRGVGRGILGVFGKGRNQR